MMGGDPKLSPKLSIIVLVYNVEPYIQRCMDSILKQDFGDFEVILVVEKRSTDSSATICAKFAERDNRIVLCYEDGTGFPAARNRGLNEAKGEFVTLIDADDYILQGMFGAMYERAIGQNLDILCCGSKKDLGGQDVGQMDDYAQFEDELFVVAPHSQRDYMYKLALNGRAILPWGKFYRRGFLEEKQLRFHPEAYADDTVFNFNCYSRATRVATMPGQYYVWYDRPGSRLYTSNISDVEKSAEIIWTLYLGYDGQSAQNVWAFAATKIVSSTLFFNLKLKPLPVEKICEVTWGMIQKLELPPHLLRARDRAKFDEYAKVVGMSETAAENYRLFIESLQSYDSMLAWQMRYKQIEEKAGKWNMAK
jgi:glycosyltransferase involved in cell wall biosynthesis